MKIKDFLNIICSDYGVRIIKFNDKGKEVVFEEENIDLIPDEFKERYIRWIDFSMNKEKYIICIENS
jgi:hypothetical protein